MIMIVFIYNVPVELNTNKLLNSFISFIQLRQKDTTPAGTAVTVAGYKLVRM